MSIPALVPLENVLLRPDVWRGDQLASLEKTGVASGFVLLDAELPGGGWPRGSLVELLSVDSGMGEVSALLPALRLSAAEAPIAIVAPPALAHAPAWAAQMSLGRLLIVDAQRDDIAWCVELLLASGGLGAVLAWLPGNVSNKTLRRLQVAAEGSRSLGFIFRRLSCAQTSSPVPLRLALEGSREGLQVRILKRRGPPCDKTLLLQVERPAAWTRVSVSANTIVPTPRRKPLLVKV